MKKENKKTIPKDTPPKTKYVKAAHMFCTTEIKNGKQVQVWGEK